MNLKNYTSTVPVDRTIARIEQVLARAGASSIVKDYSDGNLVALCFRLEMPHQKPLTIRLPANADAVYETLFQQVKRPRKETYQKLRDQAHRTAWKLMQDWLEVQVSLIRMKQAEVLQVFLAYAWDGQQTFYQALKSNNFKALPEHCEAR